MPFRAEAHIEQNDSLRLPQREGWESIRNHFGGDAAAREVGVVLPVGCGKSGLIAITPFALGVERVLVIAPGTRIRDQLGDDLRANSPTNFYERAQVLAQDAEYPEVVMVETGRVNHDDIQHCHVAVANIQQIAGEENRWLDGLAEDFFDLILVDEAHHNRAESWQQVKRRFPNARVVNFSATPARTDGTVMEGDVVYAFPVLRAIEAGYVKRLRAKMLSPTQLTYIDREDGERVIGPDEIRALGEENAEFRRGIVMSEESLSSIVDQSISELRRLREETGEPRLKIISSALNYNHCIQITEAFRARGLRADYVHSREDSVVNDRVFQKLENHELDVIVQAKMLGEGFDHKFLSVAMVASVFGNLSPFVQFVGRVMRVVEQNAPNSPVNQGVVVFHLGANIARRWDDFRQFSGADQAFFADFLPEVDTIERPEAGAEREFGGRGHLAPVEVIDEQGVMAADMAPIGDPEAQAMLERLAEMGVTPQQAANEIRRHRMSRQDRREARRASLNERIQVSVAEVLAALGANARARTLDPARRVDNYGWVISQLNSRVNEAVGGRNADRQAFTLQQLDEAHALLPEVIQQLSNGG